MDDPTQIFGWNFHPKQTGKMIQFDGCICFKWVETQPPTRYGALIGSHVLPGVPEEIWTGAELVPPFDPSVRSYKVSLLGKKDGGRGEGVQDR